MKMVDGWQKAWKWHSMQALAALALLPAVWAEVPPEVQALIPSEWRSWILAALAVIGIIGRLRAQGGEA